MRSREAFGEVDRQLRGLSQRLPSTLTNDELAEDMATARDTVETGLRDLRRDLGEQGGLLVVEATEGP